MNLFEHVAVVKPREKKSIRDQVDRYIMHPVLGYVILGLVLLLFFSLVFSFGKIVETPLLALFQDMSSLLSENMNRDTLIYTVLRGLIEGFSGGIAIVLPYLVPFLLCLSFLEDIGYLPRAAAWGRLRSDSPPQENLEIHLFHPVRLLSSTGKHARDYLQQSPPRGT